MNNFSIINVLRKHLLSQTCVVDGEFVEGRVETCSVQAVHWVCLAGSPVKCARAHTN